MDVAVGLVLEHQPSEGQRPNFGSDVLLLWVAALAMSRQRLWNEIRAGAEPVGLHPLFSGLHSPGAPGDLIRLRPAPQGGATDPQVFDHERQIARGVRLRRSQEMLPYTRWLLSVKTVPVIILFLPPPLIRPWLPFSSSTATTGLVNKQHARMNISRRDSVTECFHYGSVMDSVGRARSSHAHDTVRMKQDVSFGFSLKHRSSGGSVSKAVSGFRGSGKPSIR